MAGTPWVKWTPEQVEIKIMKSGYKLRETNTIKGRVKGSLKNVERGKKKKC